MGARFGVVLLLLCIGCALDRHGLSGQGGDAGEEDAAAGDGGSPGDDAGGPGDDGGPPGDDADRPGDDAGPGDDAAGPGDDAGRPDAGPMDAGEGDAAPPDAGPEDAGPPATCSDLYGSAAGFRLCEERATECEFYSDLSDRSCDDVCADFGGTCVAAYGDTDGSPCRRDSTDTCAQTHGDEICVCSRP